MKRFSKTRLLLILLAASFAVFLLSLAILAIAGLRDHLARADIALVLGSKVAPDGTPSPRLRARLDRTVELYRGGYFPRVIASGGKGKEGFDEAVVMRDYLVANGIPSEKVIVDSAGITTFASAQKTAEIVRQQKLGSVFVVSQYFHLPRAALALHRFGIANVYSSPPRFYESRDPYSLIRELFGYVSYSFRHYDTASHTDHSDLSH